MRILIDCYGLSLYCTGDAANVPVIVCGDFNNSPSSPIYSTMLSPIVYSNNTSDTHESLNCNAHADIFGNSSNLTGNTICLHSAYASYPSHSTSSCAEPDFTTITHRRKWTIDYIFHSPLTLTLTHLLRIPHESQCRAEV